MKEQDDDPTNPPPTLIPDLLWVECRDWRKGNEDEVWTQAIYDHSPGARYARRFVRYIPEATIEARLREERLAGRQEVRDELAAKRKELTNRKILDAIHRLEAMGCRASNGDPEKKS